MISQYGTSDLLGLTLICGMRILGDDILALIGDGARRSFGLELGERLGEERRGEEGRRMGEVARCRPGDDGRRKGDGC